MAYAFDDELPSVDDPDPMVRAAAQESADFMAQIQRDEARMAAAQAATDAANARAAGLARRDPNVYNENRPSTWNAPDSPKRTTLDRARDIQPDAEATSMAQQARADALVGSAAVDDAETMRDVGFRSLAAQQKARGLYPGEKPAEELAALRAKGGMAQAQAAYDRAGNRVRVTSPNKAYPSTTKHVTNMLGTGQVSQVAGPDGQPMFRTEIVDEPILGADGQPMLDPMNPQGPPLTRQVEKQVPVLQQDTGLIGGEREAALRVQEAELDREMMNTSLLQQQEMEQRKIHNAMLTSQMAQRKRAEAVRKNVDASYKAVQAATAEFAKADEVDPDRGWGAKGVGAKIAAIIASGLLGFAGMDPFAHIDAVINNSIDAQKANIAKRQAAVGEARGQQAAAVSAYEQIRAQIGDEAQADAAYYVSALEGIKAQALAKLSEAGVKVMTAQQAAFMNKLDQHLSEGRRQNELVAATTPESFTRYVDPRTPDQRSMDKELFKSGLRTHEKGSDQTVDIIAKRQEQGRDTQGKIDIDAAKRDYAAGDLSEGDAKLLGTHVDNIKKAGELVGLTEDFAKKWGDRDIPGRGMSRVFDWATPNDVAEMETELGMIEDELGRLQSQGAITSDELENFREWTRGGIGDASLIKNVKRIGEFANRTVIQSERFLPERLRGKYRRVDETALPGIESNITGATGRSNQTRGTTGAVVEDQ